MITSNFAFINWSKSMRLLNLYQVYIQVSSLFLKKVKCLLSFTTLSLGDILLYTVYTYICMYMYIYSRYNFSVRYVLRIFYVFSLHLCRIYFDEENILIFIKCPLPIIFLKFNGYAIHDIRTFANHRVIRMFFYFP